MLRNIAIFTLVLGLVAASCGDSFCEEGELNCTTDCGDGVYSLFISSLNSNEMELVLSDKYREMTHARISPDNDWVTFTRFNKVGPDGCATEDALNYPVLPYDESEIMAVNFDGDMRTLVEKAVDQVSVHSSWINNNEILYVHVPAGIAQINRLVLDNNVNLISDNRLSSTDIIAVDPSQVGDVVVLSATDIGNRSTGIWKMNSDGTNLEQLTVGTDNEPKLSPDGRMIAFMRYNLTAGHTGHNWHINVYDIITKEIYDVSEGSIDNYCEGDAMPEWSADGTKFVFWHLDNCGSDLVQEIWTMDIDGSIRKKVELPAGFDYFQPSFFPGSNDIIIFSARKIGETCNSDCGDGFCMDEEISATCSDCIAPPSNPDMNTVLDYIEQWKSNRVSMIELLTVLDMIQ